MRAVFVAVLDTRGILGLYAGLTPTLIQIVPYAGLHFGTYDTFKRFACGLASGTCGKSVSSPRSCEEKISDRRTAKGSKIWRRSEASCLQKYVSCSQANFACRGLGWSFYKGIAPSVVKAAPASAATFVVYEFSSKWLQSLLI